MTERTLVAATVEIPADLAAEIERARAHVEAEMGGAVKVTISWQSFTTYWAIRNRGRPVVDIELTPTVEMRTEPAAIYNALVRRGVEGGAMWAHPDMIKRMVRWLADGGQSDTEGVHSPFSDEEAARRLALEEE